MIYEKVFASSVLTACSMQAEPNPYTRISESIDFREFENPSKNYRAAPFWSLNDLLDSAELDRQIVEFAKGGYGGVISSQPDRACSPNISAKTGGRLWMPV